MSWLEAGLGTRLRFKITFISSASIFLLRVIAIAELRELVITREEYMQYLNERLQLEGSCRQEIENLSFPFIFASGSELMRTYILSASEFASTLPEEYKLPDRGFIWFLFSQAVRAIQVLPEKVVIKYELQDGYRKPFKRFYL